MVRPVENGVNDSGSRLGVAALTFVDLVSEFGIAQSK
jgi:hypothetical protein